jgi:hypothetical protein
MLKGVTFVLHQVTFREIAPNVIVQDLDLHLIIIAHDFLIKKGFHGAIGTDKPIINSPVTEGEVLQEQLDKATLSRETEHPRPRKTAIGSGGCS